MADETQVTTEEQRNSPGIAFITHGNLKHDPPLHAFITYAKGVDTDGGGEISTQLLNFSASAKKENNKTTIAISWDLNGLHHAVIRIKKVQAESDNEVDWSGVEVADTLTMGQGVTSTEYDGAQEGYKYQLEGVGVDVFGDTSEAANTPKAEVFIAKAVEPNPNPKPEPDPSPEQPTEKLFEFHYVPDEGVLPGLIFEQQTEDVINDIGNYAYFAQKTASKALKTGLEASEAARTALNAAQNAQSTADRATELGNTGISKANAAQETADKALKKAEANEVSIAANSSSIATLQNTVNGQQTQLDGNLTNISELKKQVAENKQSIDGNSKGISQCIMTIQESQRYTTTDKTDANDLTDYGRIYLSNALLHCPSGVTYPVLLDVVPSYLDDDEIDDVVVQRVVDANGVSFYRFATETTVDATTTYTFGDWKSIDTRYLKLTGGTVTGQTTFSGKLTASGETTFSGKLTASGETSVPTPSTENNSKTIANTEFVHGVVSDLVNGAPDALNTLQELATALGNDPNFSTTILNKIGEKENKTDAQIEHEKLQNAIDLSLKGKDVLRGATQDNGTPGVVNIPLEAGMFPIYGFPDGSFKEQPTYPYGIVVNFQGTSGAFLSLYSLNYFYDETEGLYYRIGFQGKGWNTTWHKVANTANVKKQVTDAITNLKTDNDALFNYMHRLGTNVVIPTSISELNKMGIFSAYYDTANIIPNQPTVYGQLINLPPNAFICTQLWMDFSGKLYYRGAGVKEVISDKTFTRFLDENDYRQLAARIPTKTSQLTNDSGFAVISNGHLVINGSELWIE